MTTAKLRGTSKRLAGLVASLTVDDGSTSVPTVSELRFTSGATVTDLTGGVAGVDITGGGSSLVGAMIDSLNVSLTALANNTADTRNLTNTVYDDGVSAFGASFIGTSSGTFLGKSCFVMPSGSDGRYDITLFFYLLATATSFPIQCGIESSSSNASGTYIQQVRTWAGTLAHYSGMTNNSVNEGAATVVAQGIPLVAGDEIVWWAKQNSGANRTIDYVRFAIRKVG